MTNLRTLYLGRFQIFHNGHLNIVKHIDSQPDTGLIVIGIGSAQYGRNSKHPNLPLVMNPFNYSEREEMLRMSLEGELSRPYQIIGINDIHVCENWLNLVCAKTHCEILYTNTRRERNLFESAGIETRPVPIKDGYHAQFVREAIADHNDYAKLVPAGTQRWIKKNGIENLLAEFYAANPESVEEVHALQRKNGTTMYFSGMKI